MPNLNQTIDLLKIAVPLIGYFKTVDEYYILTILFVSEIIYVGFFV